MPLLLMDTSGEMTVLAVADEQSGALQAVRIFTGRRTLSQRLLREVSGLLQGEGIGLREVAAFGVGLGPGSFTGVRVGVTTMKTFAQVTGKPLVGLPTLDAYPPFHTDLSFPCVAVLASRREEVYAAVYAGGKRISGPFAESVAAMQRRIEALESQGPVLVCGATGLLSQPPRWAMEQLFVPPEGLARAAAARYVQGLYDDPLALTPFYVVPPSISVPKRKQE